MKWSLHPKQARAFRSPATEILYGGAANSGKSHLMRVLAVATSMRVPGLQTYLFRREYNDLRKNHFEGPSSFPVMLADLLVSGHARFSVSDMTVSFWNGSKIFACHCQHEKDVYGYQGAEIHQLMMDELTMFSDFQYRFLRGRCRIGQLRVPADCPWTFPRVLCGTNPGGAGHNSVKARFIDPAPPLTIHRAPDDDGGMLRQFIPALMADNPTGNPEEYRKRVLGLGDSALVRAMLDGDWNVVAGGMFDDVWHADRNVVEPCVIPAGWARSRSFDWGSSKPFAVCWWAEANGEAAANGWCPPRGSLVLVAEWYGWNGQPNEGCRMLACEVARGIVEREAGMGWPACTGPADSAIFATENGDCIGDDMAMAGVRWERADKGPGSRVNGWERMRALCRQAGTDLPGLYVFASCRQTIRTIPTTPRDKRKPDDVDTNYEDHIIDAIRYRVSHTPAVAGVVPTI